ncbi:hypothetical protein D9758_013494 [Tetrapyrgos nigripes]|uniref:Uncharacterized protein n=1 Tax=Tetrapyrgos nigripes TaxID=182062 RepID=A0A8H5D0U0_9AGAR|nr:hypothetical protein D9758_013494 [Tetrapyrgos nigripes]
MSIIWAVADDDDSRVNYTGQWSSSSPQTLLDASVNLSAGRSFFALNNTLHGTSSNNASFTFNFNGTSPSPKVYGSIANDAQFKIECSLDDLRGHPSEWGGNQSLLPNSIINNVLICASPPGLKPSGTHQLSIRVFDVSKGALSTGVDVFYLDYIAYTPLSDAPVDGEYVLVGNLEGATSPPPVSPSSCDIICPEIITSTSAPTTPSPTPMSPLGDSARLESSPGWEAFQNGTLGTKFPGSTLTLTFNGTEVGMLADSFGALNSSNAVTYQLDDQPPVGLRSTSPNPGSGNETLINPDKFLLKCTSLFPDPWFEVQFFTNTLTSNVDSSHSGTSTPVPHTSETSDPIAPTSSDHHSRGGEIGGIAGGLSAFLILALLSSWICLNWKKTRKEKMLEPTPFVVVAGPDFNQYENRGSHGIPSSKHLHYAGSRDHHESDDMLNRLRWGNLKLQQRVAILLGRSQSSLQPSTPENRRTRERRIHTDSGWRMGQDDLTSDHSDETEEVPPNYTEV